jgi:hypothetical protein
MVHVILLTPRTCSSFTVTSLEEGMLNTAKDIALLVLASLAKFEDNLVHFASDATAAIPALVKVIVVPTAAPTAASGAGATSGGGTYAAAAAAAKSALQVLLVLGRTAAAANTGVGVSGPAAKCLALIRNAGIQV